jgi:hypothetical protein
MSEAAVLAQEGEFVTLGDGQQYEVKFNMRTLRDLERKYGSMTLFSMAIAGASETHGMLDATLDGLAYGLRHYTQNKKFGSPEAMVDLVALGQTGKYIRTVTRAINIALTGTPEEDAPDEGWSDLPQDVRAVLVEWHDKGEPLGVYEVLTAYVARHVTPAEQGEQSTEDGGEDTGNFLGAPGTGS